MSVATIRIYDDGGSRLHVRWFCRDSGLWREILDSLASYQRRDPSTAGRVTSRLNVSPRAARACGVSAVGSRHPCASSGTR
jgi:hypothetical protein